MENEKQQLEALQDIRKMMQESSKFLSLSGLSGVFAGIYALIGAYLGYFEISKVGNSLEIYRGAESLQEYNVSHEVYTLLKLKIVLICGAVLFLSLLTAFIFTAKKAKKNNEKLFDRTSKKVLWNMLVPLFAGGFLCLALLYHGRNFVLLISPVMLLFYGMALLNSSKFVIHDIKILGYLEIILGLFACVFLGHGILFWALGFGVLHIIYGAYMWYKFDRNK